MTTPFWCLLVAVLIPYFLSPIVVAQRVKQLGKLDNKYPREQQAKLTGLGARAQAAENNAFEALPIFASAVFVSHLAGANPSTAATLSLVFIAARLAHAIFYLTNIDALRSLSWLVGLACCIALFVISA
jgi:uncharacterized MAPEG superfamily protein